MFSAKVVRGILVAGKMLSDGGRQEGVPPRPAQKSRGDFFVAVMIPSKGGRQDEVPPRPTQKLRRDFFVAGKMASDGGWPKVLVVAPRLMSCGESLSPARCQATADDLFVAREMHSDGDGEKYGLPPLAQNLCGNSSVASYEPSDRGRLKRFAAAACLMLWGKTLSRAMLPSNIGRQDEVLPRPAQ